MNFSDVTSFSGQAEFSPNSEFIAAVKGIKITVYESTSMAAVQSWNLLDQVSKLEWSLDSNLVMCSQQKRGIIQVFNLKDPKWDCKVTLGTCGLSGAWLAPDSRHIITICQFQIRLNIWSLVKKSILALQYPKFGTKGVIFSKCRNFTGILRRISGKDYMTVLDAEYNTLSNFNIKSNDTENVYWTNDNYYIIAYAINTWIVYTPAGEIVYEHAQELINIDSSLNSVHGCYSALSLYDNSIKIIHHITWNTLCNFSHTLEIHEKNLIVYQEIETLENNRISYSYEMKNVPVKLVGVNDCRRVSIAKWSHNERYIACNFGMEYIDTTPNVVFIWDINSIKLRYVLIHKNSVKFIEWCTTHSVCAIATGNNRIYLWTEEGASLCDLPFGNFYTDRELSINKLTWSPDGQGLIVREKSNFVVAYPQLDEIAN
jgi:hypothetical protein